MLLCVYIVDRFRFSSSYSRYTREKIVRQNEIKSNGSLSISLDSTKLQNMQDQLQKMQRSCQQHNDEIQTIQTDVSNFILK